MSVLVGAARIDENGKLSYGKPGDQTGKEVCMHTWSLNKKGYRTFRFKNKKLANRYANVIATLCQNDCVGYCQAHNTSLWKELESLNWDYTKLNKNVETDCAQLVRAALMCIGIKTDFFTTANESESLLKTGYFVELTGKEYNTISDYLQRGDIQVTKKKGHTISIIKNTYSGDLPSEVVKKGCKGQQVKLLQKFLNYYDIKNKLSVDGSFGIKTLDALMHFQQNEGLIADGSFGRLSRMKARAYWR